MKKNLKEPKKDICKEHKKEIFKKTKEEILKENNSKENFSKIIQQILLEYSKKLIDNNQHIRLINIAYDIIINNIDSDDWYFKKYLEIFFFYQKNEIYSEFNPYYCNYRNPYELLKIKYLLQKYKLSEIIKLFLNRIQIQPKYVSNKLYYFEINRNLLYYRKGFYFLLRYLIIDIKIHQKFELCTTAMEQLLYIIEYETMFSTAFSFKKFTQF